MALTQSGQVQFYQKDYNSADYVFTFGPYKGAKLGDVQAIDPAYVAWCYANVGGFSTLIQSGYGLLANQGNPPDSKLGERSWICTVCNQPFPESQIRRFRGKYYCIPNGDYKDIASILKTERARRYKPALLGTERVIPPIVRG